MADITVSLDASDLPVILEALEFKIAALRRTASEKLKKEQQPLIVHLDLLINTFAAAKS